MASPPISEWNRFVLHIEQQVGAYVDTLTVNGVPVDPPDDPVALGSTFSMASPLAVIGISEIQGPAATSSIAIDNVVVVTE